MPNGFHPLRPDILADADVRGFCFALIAVTIEACARAEFGEWGGSSHDWDLPNSRDILAKAVQRAGIRPPPP